MTKPGAPKLLLLLLVAVAVAAAALSSCSPKKNNAATRRYQAFITRYNIYYNGDTHYKETLKEMEEGYQDDYSSLLLIHPAVARGNTKAPQPAGNFDRSIEKAQKAIQLRSIKKKPKKQAGKSSDPAYKEWMKREEYNPFLHNAWMMMGRSQYLNGDFLGAASTFFYISRHFSWLPATVTEARLWEARSYLAMDWLFEAETILRRIKPEADLVNGELKGLYYTTEADLMIKEQEWEKGAEMLRKAIPHVSKAQRTRLNFLLGQVYSRAGKKELAYKAFQASGSSSSASYRTKFNARIKQSEVFTGEDISKEVGALRRMTRYDRNKEYLDQIYYAIGNLYLSRRDTARAIENYELAVEKSTRSGIDKAMAQLTLGGLYYDRRLYAKAQPCYSEALPVIPDNYPGYAGLKRRSDVLDELAVYSQNVELQDSLLRLAAMTPEQQMEVIDKLIADLKEKEKKEAEAAAREEFMANRGQDGLQDQNNQVFTMNTGDDSWYFYNTATKNAGRTEFQRRWGNRKLEDDWRRRNKQTFSFNDFGSDTSSPEEAPADDDAPSDSIPAPDQEALQKENDPHFPEYYLRQIPKTDLEKQTANDIIQEGLYNMGVILKDKMEDFPAAETEFETLLRRYPDNIYRLDAYYNMYLMYMRAGDLAKAERYRQLILSDFPDTKYGLALRDPDYIGSLRRMQEMEGKLYDDALDAYLENRNSEVHSLYSTVSKDFPLSKLMPKFMFLEALAYVTDRKPEEFKQTLMELLERYPNTDLTEFASSYLKGLAQGRKLQHGVSNMRGMLWDTRLGNDSIPSDTTELKFDLDPSQRQLLVLLFPTDEINPNALLFEVARHNFSSFVVKDFDLEQMNFGRLGLLIIKGFSNVSEINHYLKVMYSSSQFELPPQVRPVVISVNNFDTLLRGGGSFDEYFRYMRDKTYEDTQERVLPSEFFEHEPPGVAPEGYEDEYPAPEESVPEAAPAPHPEVEPEPEPGPEQKPEPEPEQKPEPVPAPEPAPEAPKPSQTTPPAAPAQPTSPAVPAKPAPIVPSLPDYPEGSEGDDPLLD
ncbi:MAG: tetratricopeptide repeat protein [Muribaculaceae bacterium]|nr:tetratricopeptide repeat protein [Muribaculaceae bacterium]